MNETATATAGAYKLEQFTLDEIIQTIAGLEAALKDETEQKYIDIFQQTIDRLKQRQQELVAESN